MPRPRKPLPSHLSAEWHPTKNGDLCPSNVSSFSNEKVWWICKSKTEDSKCQTDCNHPHEWEASIASRSAGSGCPLCTSGGRKGMWCPCRSLEARLPALTAEWHPTKNGDLCPSNVSAFSNEKVWWICKSKTEDSHCQTDCNHPHEWEASIASRSKGNGCPLCGSRGRGILCPCQSLETRLPELAADWHPTKNGKLRPSDVSVGSHNNVWWICTSKSEGSRCQTDCIYPHEWKSTVYNRVNDRGCPWCSAGGTILCPCQSLEARMPALAAEWHPTKNGKLRPSDVSVGSHNKVWWICTSKSEGSRCQTDCIYPHEWKSTVCNRVNGTGCPFCSYAGTVLCPCQSLEARLPELAVEWHPTKNGKLCPSDVSAFSNERVWWICRPSKTRASRSQSNCNYLHEWEAIVGSRAGGSGCPQCSVNKAEMQLFKILSTHALVSQHEKRTILCDDPIQKKRRRLTPDCMGVTACGSRFLIELDGPQHFQVVYWYESKGSDLCSQITRDLAKNRYAVEHAMSLLRVAYTEYGELEQWVNRFLERCEQETTGGQRQVFLCSNPALYNGQRKVKLNMVDAA